MCSLLTELDKLAEPSITASLPLDLQPYLTLLSCPTSLCIPICLLCSSAILPKSLPEHFRKTHPQQFASSLRPVLKSLIPHLPSITFSCIPPNPHNSPPIPELKTVSAYQCKSCLFIRRDLTDVRKHLNQEHGVSAKDGYEEIKAQSWFGGRWAVYWRVRDGKEGEGKEGEGKEEMKIPPCVWGLFGAGWGDKKPRTWENMEDEAMVYESCAGEKSGEGGG